LVAYKNDFFSNKIHQQMTSINSTWHDSDWDRLVQMFTIKCIRGGTTEGWGFSFVLEGKHQEYILEAFPDFLKKLKAIFGDLLYVDDKFTNQSRFRITYDRSVYWDNGVDFRNKKCVWRLQFEAYDFEGISTFTCGICLTTNQLFDLLLNMQKNEIKLYDIHRDNVPIILY
jgi:hypothetical protein